MTSSPPNNAGPSEWIPLRSHEVEAYRRLDCPHYSACLNTAAVRRWEGFTCIFCPLADTPRNSTTVPLTNPDQLWQTLEDLFSKAKKGKF